MSMFPSTGLIEDVLELIKNDTPYLALYTNDPGPNNTGSEVAGGSYARQSITFGTIASGTMDNDNTVTFTLLPAAVITHYGIFDAVSGGNLLAYGQLTTEIVAEDGDGAVFDPASIVATFIGT